MGSQDQRRYMTGTAPHNISTPALESAVARMIGKLEHYYSLNR